MVNSIVPSLLISQLLPLLMCAAKSGSAYVVNVSSAEGQFSAPKTGEHVHTNMAKASLNMITHTLSYLSQYNIHVTSVDTGWVSRMRPGNSNGKSIPPPLSPEDGAVRVTHPIVEGSKPKGMKFSGVLLKDFKVVPW